MPTRKARKTRTCRAGTGHSFPEKDSRRSRVRRLRPVFGEFSLTEIGKTRPDRPGEWIGVWGGFSGSLEVLQRFRHCTHHEESNLSLYVSGRGHYLMTMKTYRYRVVDVFTEKRLEGNPLAVFPEASGLDDATMQRIAPELKL